MLRSLSVGYIGPVLLRYLFYESINMYSFPCYMRTACYLLNKRMLPLVYGVG